MTKQTEPEEISEEGTATAEPPTKTYSDAQMIYDRIQSVEASLLTLKAELNPQAISGVVLQGIEQTLNPILGSIDTRIRHLESGGIREDLIDGIAARLADKLKEDDAG